jgi:hypothetical protein
MVFQGEVLPIGALLERAQTAPAYKPGAGVGVRHTAADNADRCAVLLAAGDTPEACWRFGILQTLDDYSSTCAGEGRRSRRRCSRPSRHPRAPRALTRRSRRWPISWLSATAGRPPTGR